MTQKIILACLILTTFHAQLICKKKNAQAKVKPSKPTYPYPNKLIKDMDVLELEEVLKYGTMIKDTELVFKAYSQLFSKCKSQEKLKNHKINCADYCFQIQDYEKAILLYEEFLILFPGSDQAEYAQYKVIVCMFLMSLDFDRDQTNTQRTISLCLLFQHRVKNELFATETLNIYKNCRKRLFDHEVYVFETYMKLCKFKSAHKRLEYIEKEFKDITNYDQYLMYCKEKLALFENEKTRPFYIQLNIEQALNKDTQKDITIDTRRLTSFFLA